MNKFLRLLTLALLAVCSVACNDNILPEGENGGNGDNGGNGTTVVTFAVEVSDISPIRAKVSAVPSDNTATYYFDVVSKADFEKYYDAKTNAKKMVSDLKKICAEMGCTLADVLFTGAKEYRFGGLTPDTEHYALVFGVTADGAISTEVATVLFKTSEEVVDAEMTFDVKVSEVTSNSAYVTVTPSNKSATYYFDVVSKEELGRYTDENAYAKKLIASIKEYYDFYEGNFTLNLSAGADGYQFDENMIAPNTDYYAFAFGVTTEGTITTEVTLVPFKTL